MKVSARITTPIPSAKVVAKRLGMSQERFDSIQEIVRTGLSERLDRSHSDAPFKRANHFLTRSQDGKIGKMKIKREDQVVLIAGKDKGKKGRVRRLLAQKNLSQIEGGMMIKTHV